PEAVGVLDIRQSPEENIVALARAKGCAPEDITVCMLERPRHDELAKQGFLAVSSGFGDQVRVESCGPGVAG
ncbi:MAG: fructose-bisphosphatase class II, partial [Actinomycetes bacterium]